MNNRDSTSRSNRWLDSLVDTMAGWKFPLFALVGLAAFWALLVGLLTIPPDESGLGAFARDVRTWCFNYDPATGQMDWFYVGVMLSKPPLLGSVIVLIWWGQLKHLWHYSGASIALVSGAAIIGVGLVGAGFAFIGEPDDSVDGDYPFPAERIRTELDPPDFELEDHTGESLSLKDLEGDVVVLTAVYATCYDSCPIILAKLTEIIDEFEDHHDEITVVAITLDPENDGPEELTQLAERHGAEAPLYRLLHGEPDEVNRVLDEFSISRVIDRENNEIDHANLYFVIDRQGSIAYRVSLGDRTKNWLSRAIEVVLADPPTAVADGATR